MTAFLDYLPTWDGTGPCTGQAALMANTDQAIATCRECPVLDECRDWVLSIPLHLGPDDVVAAMTFAERERILLDQLPPRQCIACKQIKPLHKFGQSSPGRPERRAVCKTCTSAQSRNKARSKHCPQGSPTPKGAL